MPDVTRRTAVALVAAATVVAGAGLVASAAPARAATVTLGSTSLPDSFASVLALPHVTHDGAYTASSMTVGVWIPGDTAALEAYAAAVQTPGSPSYGATLTPAEVRARFGVSPLVSAETQQLLEAQGLTPSFVAPDGQYVELTGSSDQVEKTFGVSLEAVTIAGRSYFANSGDATVPSTVGAVLGLTDLTDMVAADSQDMCDVDGIEPKLPAGVSTANACIGITTGQDLASVYDAPSSTGGAYTPSDTSTDYGQGERIAVFGEGNVGDIVTSLRTMEDATTFPTTTDISKAKLPHVPVREVLVNDPQNASSDTSGEGEFELDSQSSTQMSPLLSELDLYFGNNLSDQSISGTYSAWVNDPDGPAIGNSSFGGCEPAEYISGGEATDDALLAEGVTEGRSMFVSTGDAGAGGCQALVNAGQPGVPAIEDPGSSAYVTAVGGTVVYSKSTGTGAQAQPPARDLEYGWNDSTGGYADFSAMPADQKAVVGGTTEEPATLVCAGAGGQTCREVPDVAAMSGDAVTDAFAVFSCKGTAACTESDVLGTSLASPLWASMWARIAAAHNPSLDATCKAVAASSQPTLGFAQQDLYQLAGNATLDAKDFFNVGGTTSSLVTSNYAYSTQPRSPADPTGYSLVTGLGTPDVGQMITDLDCSSAPVAAATAPSDVVTVVDAGTIPTYTCSSGTQVTGATPESAQAAGDPGQQLASSTITGSSTGATFTITTKGAPTSASTDDSFVTIFGVNGVNYGVDVDPAGGAGYGESGATPTPGTAAFRLVYLDLDVVAGEAPVFVPMYLATLTGTASPATGTYTVNLPYSTFNTAAASVAGFQALSQASVLDPVEVLGGSQPAFSSTAAQQESNNTVTDTLQYGCAQYLAAAPTASVPEVEVPAALLGAGVVASVVALRRRRRRAA